LHTHAPEARAAEGSEVAVGWAAVGWAVEAVRAAADGKARRRGERKKRFY